MLLFLMFSNGNTALHLAVIQNNINIVRLLIEGNANCNIKNYNDMRPIDVANDEDILKLLNLHMQ